MKNFFKLLLYVFLSIGVTYFFISNYFIFSDMNQTIEFCKHGTEQDVLDYIKYVDTEMKKSVDITEVQDENQEQTEKKYKTIDDIAVDYPMGATFYSMTMSRGELQIDILSMSFIIGIMIGVNAFIFITDKDMNFKQIAIKFGISFGIALLTIELVQVITLWVAYGIFTFVGINMTFVIVEFAIFLFALSINRTIYDVKQNKKEQEQEIKEKIAKKMRKNK